MVRHNVKHFIFSSMAATFGESEYSPIDEKYHQEPINPYEASKLMVERVLRDHASAVLVADATLAKDVLNWMPEYADLETIIRHAWDWEKKIQKKS